jgi:MoaA/NifB/PqqE/SkfB family radical SAM enzyme
LIVKSGIEIVNDSDRHMQKSTNDRLNKVISKTIKYIPYRFGEMKELITISLNIVKYLTPLKLSNLLIREFEILKAVERPRGFPFHAVIDITNACNLQCPYCPTGRRQNSGRSRRIIDIDLLRMFLDNIGKYLIIADLFNWGEPLLHPQIDFIVRMFHERRIFHHISTNLNIRNKQVLEKVCDAGLDFLTVSISGITQEVYERYHKGGDANLVLDNINYIINYKKKLKYINPIIAIKYLVFKHNVHQIDKARKLAKEFGVDIFWTCYAGGPEDKIIPRDEEKIKLLYPGTGKFCSELWRTIILNCDGGITPCCLLYFKQDDFAEYSQANMFNIVDIMSNNKYVIARKIFKISSVAELPQNLQHPCLKCTFVHRQRHLTEYLASNPNAKQAHRTGGP